MLSSLDLMQVEAESEDRAVQSSVINSKPNQKVMLSGHRSRNREAETEDQVVQSSLGSAR